MANFGTMKVEGLQQLASRFRALASDVQDRIGQKSTNAGGIVIRNKAKAKAPIAPADYEVEGVKVQRGNLRKQIVTKGIAKGKRQLAGETLVVVRGRRKDGYANRIGQLQEFGTVKMEPNAFMRPAFQEGKAEAVQSLKSVLTKELGKVGA